MDVDRTRTCAAARTAAWAAGRTAGWAGRLAVLVAATAAGAAVAFFVPLSPWRRETPEWDIHDPVHGRRMAPWLAWGVWTAAAAWWATLAWNIPHLASEDGLGAVMFILCGGAWASTLGPLLGTLALLAWDAASPIRDAYAENLERCGAGRD